MILIDREDQRIKCYFVFYVSIYFPLISEYEISDICILISNISGTQRKRRYVATYLVRRRGMVGTANRCRYNFIDIISNPQSRLFLFSDPWRLFRVSRAEKMGSEGFSVGRRNVAHV